MRIELENSLVEESLYMNDIHLECHWRGLNVLLVANDCLFMDMI